jgi:hypothetical protein
MTTTKTHSNVQQKSQARTKPNPVRFVVHITINAGRVSVTDQPIGLPGEDLEKHFKIAARLINECRRMELWPDTIWTVEYTVYDRGLVKSGFKRIGTWDKAIAPYMTNVSFLAEELAC